MKNIVTPELSENQGISLRDLWNTTLKRKWTVITVALAAFTLTAVISFLVKPTYTAEGQILIEREPNILSFENMFQLESFKDDYYQTQYKLLQSRALARETIERLRLYENEAFAMTVIDDREALEDDLNNDPTIKRKFINEFLDRLSIRPVKKTRLIQASFSDRDPQLAAECLNALFEAYIDMNNQKKYLATEQAADFLSDQIAQIKNSIEANEIKLQDYGKEKNILALDSTENTVVEKLGELNKALTGAQIDRINKETYYNEIKMATPDFIPDIMNNSMIQNLREEYNRLQRDYAMASDTYLPDYPDLQKLKAELDQAKSALEAETKALISRAYSDFQTALSREKALADAFNRQKRETFQLNNNAIQYNSLMIQIQNEKDLLETLMRRKSESDISSRLKGLGTSNIWIVDNAEIPSSPSRPDKAKYMIFGLFFGMFTGLGLALFLESLDKTVKSTDDVQKYTGMPMLGMIPEFSSNGLRSGYGEEPEDGDLVSTEDQKPGWTRTLERIRIILGLANPEHKGNDQESMDLVVHFSPKSTFAEHYRSIRTRLTYSTENTELRAFAVTSPLPGEGKTATICNVAVALAQAGKRVVIIDSDIRKPRLHRVFRVQNLNGLTKYLAEEMEIDDLLRATPIPTLFLINSGPVPPNPLELLESEKMSRLIEKLKTSFDYILLDTPPLLAVSDALVVGVLVDGAILVVRGGETPREAMILAGEKLQAHSVKRMGVILNGVHERDFNAYYYTKYYEYGRRT